MDFEQLTPSPHGLMIGSDNLRMQIKLQVLFQVQLENQICLSKFRVLRYRIFRKEEFGVCLRLRILGQF
jgi:hypothetical protein